VIPNFIYWAMKGLPLPITGSGKSRAISPTSVISSKGFLRPVFWKVLWDRSLTWHLGVETRILGLAETVNRITRQIRRPAVCAAPPVDTKSRLLASIDRAKNLLGYRPQMPFEEGLGHTVRWFEYHWGQIEAGG